MSITPNDPHLVFLPLPDTATASGLCDVTRDHWWIVCPEKGLVFYQGSQKRKGSVIGASPQCNRDEGTARRLQERLYPWAKLERIPLVIVSIDPSDYE